MSDSGAVMYCEKHRFNYPFFSACPHCAPTPPAAEDVGNYLQQDAEIRAIWAAHYGEHAAKWSVFARDRVAYRALAARCAELERAKTNWDADRANLLYKANQLAQELESARDRCRKLEDDIAALLALDEKHRPALPPEMIMAIGVLRDAIAAKAQG